MVNEKITIANKLTGLTVVGKINLAQFAPKRKKSQFKPYSGGFRLGEVPVKRLA